MPTAAGGSRGRGRREDPVQILLIVIAVVVALVVIGAVIEAAKWLLFLAVAVFVLGLFAGWWRRA